MRRGSAEGELAGNFICLPLDVLSVISMKVIIHPIPHRLDLRKDKKTIPSEDRGETLLRSVDGPKEGINGCGAWASPR